MHAQTQAPTKVPANKERKPVGNWMQLKIAPLIAERIKKSKPLPGKGH